MADKKLSPSKKKSRDAIEARKEKAALELRPSHVALGYLGSHLEMATTRVEQAGYHSPRVGRNGPVYVLRRKSVTIPLELTDVGVARPGTVPDIGWNYSTEDHCFLIKTIDMKLQGEVLTKLFSFKETAGEFLLGGIKIRLVQDSTPAKWHVALYHSKGVSAKLGFSVLCSRNIVFPGDIFDNISTVFTKVSKTLTSDGIFMFEVPGLPGFSIEVMFGRTSLSSHALEARTQDKPY